MRSRPTGRRIRVPLTIAVAATSSLAIAAMLLPPSATADALNPTVSPTSTTEPSDCDSTQEKCEQSGQGTSEGPYGPLPPLEEPPMPGPCPAQMPAPIQPPSYAQFVLKLECVDGPMPTATIEPLNDGPRPQQFQLQQPPTIVNVGWGVSHYRANKKNGKWYHKFDAIYITLSANLGILQLGVQARCTPAGFGGGIPYDIGHINFQGTTKNGANAVSEVLLHQEIPANVKISCDYTGLGGFVHSVPRDNQVYGVTFEGKRTYSFTITDN
jgi:hypothetical protein